MKKPTRASVSIIFSAAISTCASASTYFVSTTGSDGANGSIDTPFLTFSKAIATAHAGDTIYARGGTYNLSSTLSIKNKPGTAALPYTISAYQNETPILDFSSEPQPTSANSGMRGIQIDTDYWTLKGLEVKNAKDNGVLITGSHNTLDQLRVHGSQDTGVQISGSGGRVPSYNLVKNTDSYENDDYLGHGENADGFSAKFRDLGPGNVFSGDRSYRNSDDGWDFWAAASGVTIENSWSFKNGVNVLPNLDKKYAGDGNGIKLGHDSGTHLLKNLLVWGNPYNGVDINGNGTKDATIDPSTADAAAGKTYTDIAHGVTVENVTAYNNGAGNKGHNFNFDENVSSHTLINNISFGGGFNGAVVMGTGVVNNNNSWNGKTITSADFVSLSDAMGMSARLPDGNLPISGFLRLIAASSLIDAGINYPGVVYTGSAPDIGDYELNLPLPGDADLNGTVDVADFTAFFSNFGASSGANWLQGDFDYNGMVDVADFTLFFQNFGSSGQVMSPEMAAFAKLVGVPEPGTIAICALGALSMIRRRRA